MSFLETFAAKLPAHWQRELRRVHFLPQPRRGTFRSDEPEYELLGKLLRPGECALDIGANVGHYTLRVWPLQQCDAIERCGI